MTFLITFDENSVCKKYLKKLKKKKKTTVLYLKQKQIYEKDSKILNLNFKY